MAHSIRNLPPDTMRSFAIILLATAVLAAPKENPKKQDKRSVVGSDLAYSSYGLPSYGLSSYGLPSYGLSGLGLSGYSTGLGTRFLGSGLVGNSLASAYASGLEYGTPGVIIGNSVPSTGYGLNVLPSLAKAERITGVTLHREVQVPVPVPQPVPFEVTKHVPVPQPVPVKVDRPYPVPVPQPVPVEVTRHVPVKVDRPYPVPVPQPVEVRVPQPVPVPVSQPVPVPVSVTRHVPVSVPSVNVVPSTYVSSPIGVATTGLLPTEYADLGSSHLGSISSLNTGFSSGLDSGVVSGGVISSGLAPFGSTALASPHDNLDVVSGIKPSFLKNW